MRLEFGDFVLDTRQGVLLCKDREQALEPRAFDMLCLLVENHDRLVSKDELLEKVWDGRIVTDSAVSTVVKAVRKALGDNGEAQLFVRTVRGRGYRFVASVRILADNKAGTDIQAVGPRESDVDSTAPVSRQPSLAVLPFATIGYSESFSVAGDAIPTELISSLSRLRWLKVIARGSSFRFRQREVDPGTVGDALGVAYCISGTVEILGTRLTVAVELVDTNSCDVIWGEHFTSGIDEIHDIRTRIVSHIIAALELHIPQHEADKARLNSPGVIDAWGEYHIGLQHMYRFNQADNEIATRHFEHAISVDPRFARAHAARSFTSFQRAFLKYSPDPAKDTEDARRFAERSIELDPLDPFGNFNLARTYWLAGDPDSGLEMLARAIEVNPNYAQAHYARAYTDAMAGRGNSGIDNVSAAIALSPLDPLLYAMRATRGFSHMIQGDHASAAEWAERGARSPGSHYLIGAIAAAAHHLNGNSDKAAYWAENVRKRRPDASIRYFFSAFPFSDQRVRSEISGALSALRFPE